MLNKKIKNSNFKEQDKEDIWNEKSKDYRSKASKFKS